MQNYKNYKIKEHKKRGSRLLLIPSMKLVTKIGDERSQKLKLQAQE